MYNKNDSLEESKRLMEAMRRLGSLEFRPVIDYLKSIREQSADTLTHSQDSVVLYRMQGRCQVIDEILEAVAKATRS